MKKIDRPGVSPSSPPRGDPQEGLSWWWGRDEERFHGPCTTRAEAIMDAWSDDPDSGAYICQARQGEWRTEVVDARWLAEAFDDANEETSDPDGDGASALLTAEAWKALAGRMNALVRQAIRSESLCAWGFEQQTGPEWVDIPAMWRMAEWCADGAVFTS